MGWCSGTDLFDSVIEVILDDDLPYKEQVDDIAKIIEYFEDNDWDCQDDSSYYDFPIVKDAFKKVHPDWFEDEVKPIKPTPIQDVTVSAVQLRQIFDRIARLTDMLTEQKHRIDVIDKLFKDELDKQAKFVLKVEAANSGQMILNSLFQEQIREIKQKLEKLGYHIHWSTE